MQKVIRQIHQIFTTLLTGVFLFIGLLFFNHLATPAALARPLTPEAAEYEIAKPGSPIDRAEAIQQRSSDYTANELARDTQYTTQAVKNRAEDLRSKTQELSDRASNASGKAIDQSKDNAKGLFENVKEKLNLDEPLPQSTKDFIHDITGQED